MILRRKWQLDESMAKFSKIFVKIQIGTKKS